MAQLIAAPALQAQLVVIDSTVGMIKQLVEDTKIQGLQKRNLLQHIDAVAALLLQYANDVRTPIDPSILPDPLVGLTDASDFKKFLDPALVELLDEQFEKELAAHGEPVMGILTRYAESIGEEAESVFQDSERPVTAGGLDILFKIAAADDLKQTFINLEEPIKLFQKLLERTVVLNVQQALRQREAAKNPA